jgi:hypothetical protein
VDAAEVIVAHGGDYDGYKILCECVAVETMGVCYLSEVGIEVLGEDLDFVTCVSYTFLSVLVNFVSTRVVRRCMSSRE